MKVVRESQTLHTENIMQTRPLNATEAAEYLKISKNHLYHLVSERKISCYRPEGKLIYFSIVDLDAFIYRNRQATDYELAHKDEAMLNGKAQ